ncbi:hypothetical protein BDV32DRAFT_119488 [Aspergillus pseudonomiae]|uniref:Uncharacterized protein n=1 Tax=Aspergillus pseudonomiae TaxID=1506151 RepID=A0A5N7DQ95_9EURO|nr:uncharacterized protein BDV37DRAFT_156728 [Aspergillus pseudonomiae]KAB8263160.1 hypothetical protein BDV32DRAFT_119488 [Aspergillus pseudonomiae]KAE8408594.1 hypothetical protein BDV37DRAFT_156728 [Aspergillus pseudonomiae]
MAYPSRLHFLLTLFRELFNTFIHSTGDDPLLARTHRSFQNQSAQTNNVLLLVPITLGLILNLLIRYWIGHVLLSLLILETVEKHADASDLGAKKPAPSSRQLLRTSATLYRKGGIHLLLNGIGSACTYWAMHISVAKLSTTLLPSPAAHILASLLLAETHFLWTARTILPHDQLRFVSNPGDRRQWKALALPTLVYAAAETVMMHVPALFDSSSITPPPDEAVTIARLLYIVRSDILVAGLMLSAQLFLLLPSYMVLILVQISLLPPTCETLIFRQQRRGRRVGEIFSAVNRGPLHAQKAVQMIGMGRLLSCLELHGKMCLCLVGVAAVVHSVIYCML